MSDIRGLEWPGGAALPRGLDSVRVRVAMLLVFLFIAMMAIVGYQAYQLRERLVESAMERVSATARLAAGIQTDTASFRVERVLFALAEYLDSGRLVNDPGCDAYLAAKLRTEPRFTNIAIITPNGNFACTAVPVAESLNVGDRDYFRGALVEKEPVIGEAVFGRVTGKWTLPFATALRDPAGRVRYVLLVTLDLQWLSGQMEQAQLAQDARMGLIAANGLVVVRYPDPEKWVGRNASDTAFFRTVRARGGEGTAESLGFDGIPRIYGFAPFAKTLAGPIYLWVGVSKESVVGEGDRQYAWTMMVALLVLVVVFGMAWLGGERLILGPVRAIADAAQRLAMGDSHARTGIGQAKGELGRLAHIFDHMAEMLASTNRLLRAEEATRIANQEVRKSRDELQALNGSLEDRVKARTVALEAANKELEAFAYSVSHDLRAPLRTIDGFSKILEEDYAGKVDDEGRDSLHRVRAAAQKMGNLIDDILKLSRLTRSEMTPERVDLSALARSVAEDLGTADPARSVEFDIASGLVARGDRNLLKVLLENLLGNAWKFTSRHPSARIQVGALDKDGETVFYVRDDGAGFDMAHVAELFGPFQRLHGTAEFPGTGIGLATVNRIVQRHGGHAWGEGAIEKGATFFFTLGAKNLRASAKESEDMRPETVMAEA